MSTNAATGQAFRLSVERLKHLAWAALIAGVLQVATLLTPLDQVLRTVQYYFASFDASGEIVFVGADFNLADPSVPDRRVELANLVERLDRAGAREIYIDVVFDRASTPQSDAELNAALRAARGRAVLIENFATGVDGAETIEDSIPAVGAGVPRVAGRIWTNFLNYAWYMPYTEEIGGTELESASLAMSGVDRQGADRFPISYYFDIGSIPNFRFDQWANPNTSLAQAAGKTVVIGVIDPPTRIKPNIPGLPSVSPSIIHIYAAETLKAGHTTELGGLAVLAGMLALLVAFAFVQPRRWRIAGIVVICLALPCLIYVTAQMAIRTSAASAFFFLIIYGVFRARATWKRSFHLTDAETDLPSFAALEANSDVAQNVPAIIVARIHRFEEVRRTLPKEMHAEYVLRIIARLKAATQEATIYRGKGNMIAWTMPEKDPNLVHEHLEGLRALFSAPLRVGETQVDVGITFGVDVTASTNVTRRLAAAVSAAEQTTESFEPIAIAESASEEDLIWNISLQARIDAALTNGEIYLVYQPKVSVQTGVMIGVEALARWNDPVRGHIPPDQFIRQCETSGRMAHLTRHVLTGACVAGNAFARAGLPLAIAVNVSATLLHERRIVHEVREVLEQTGFAPDRLVLEITETYRITNLDLAAEILGELKELGAKISMDDFGVGAASFEALMKLPFCELKIDRLFIAAMTSNAKAAGIVRSVLALGRDLRITVVAEGVEDAQTLTMLRESGCQVAQGFGISRPVGFTEILEFHEVMDGDLLRNMV